MKKEIEYDETKPTTQFSKKDQPTTSFWHFTADPSLRLLQNHSRNMESVLSADTFKRVNGESV